MLVALAGGRECANAAKRETVYVEGFMSGESSRAKIRLEKEGDNDEDLLVEFDIVNLFSSFIAGFGHILTLACPPECQHHSRQH